MVKPTSRLRLIRWFLFGALPLAAFPLGGCAASDVVATGPCSTSTDCTVGECVAGQCVRETGTVDGGSLCDGVGPTVQVGDGTTSRCAGTVAQTTFRFALCSCEGLVVADRLITDSFDSRVAGAAISQGGAVGINQRLDAATAGIGGALWAAEGATFRAPSEIGGDVHSGADLVSGSELVIAGDADVAGRVDVSELQIAGALTQPAGAAFSAGAGSTVGSREEGPVTVTAPCDCEGAAAVDVAALVRARATDNDNARIGLDDRAFDGGATGRELRLPCGRYYLSRLSAQNPVTVTATGRAALFIDGDLALESRLEVRTEGDAELDVFVAGNIVTSNDLALGSVATPSRVRLYVGGTGTLQLSAGTTIAGHLYAPGAELVSSGRFEAYGSVFVRRVAAAGPITVHYDRAVLDLAQECPPPPDQCDSCIDCGNQACVGGTCGACRDDVDCCAPLVCFDGRCSPQIF